MWDDAIEFHNSVKTGKVSVAQPQEQDYVPPGGGEGDDDAAM